MKKILACATCLLSMVAANSASAAYTLATASVIVMGTAGTTSTTNPELRVQLSSNVQMDYAATATTGLYYTVAAYHNKGTRTFSSTSNDSKIFYAITTAATTMTLPITAGTTAPSTTWTAL